jgi:hypothetical protein
LTEQDYSSRHHLQKWLTNVSPVIQDVFSKRRWLNRSGAIATLRYLQLIIQQFSDVTSQIRFWTVPWRQHFETGNYFAPSLISTLPALYSPSPRTLPRKTPSMPTPQNNLLNYTVVGNLDNRHPSELVSPSDINSPGLTSTAARKSLDTNGDKNDILTSVPPHFGDLSQEKRFLLIHKDPVLNEIAMANYLAGEIHENFKDTFLPAFMLQQNHKSASLKALNLSGHHSVDSASSIIEKSLQHTFSPRYYQSAALEATNLIRHLPVRSASTILKESLQHSVSPQFRSPLGTDSLPFWQDSAMWPAFSVTAFEPQLSTSLSPPESVNDTIEILSEYRSQVKSLDMQTGKVMKDLPVLISNHISAKPTSLRKIRNRSKRPYKVWASDIAPAMQAEKEIHRQFRTFHPQIASVVNSIPRTESLLVRVKSMAIEEMRLKGIIQDSATPVEEMKLIDVIQDSTNPVFVDIKAPITPERPLSLISLIHPTERTQMVRLAAEMHRQFNTVQSQTQLSPDVHPLFMTSSREAGTPSYLYSYPGNESTYPELLLRPRDSFVGLSQAVTRLTEEVKVINHKDDNQGKHEVHNNFNVTVENDALEEDNSSALSHKLGNLLANEARRHGISI